MQWHPRQTLHDGDSGAPCCKQYDRGCDRQQQALEAQKTEANRTRGRARCNCDYPGNELAETRALL
jgi:hypothetical protein